MNKKDLKHIEHYNGKKFLFYYSLMSLHLDLNIPINTLVIDYDLKDNEIDELHEIIKKIKNNESNQFKELTIKIIENLNEFTGKKMRYSKLAEKNIKQIFNLKDENNEKFITIQDFFMVNEYFSKDWNTPQLEKYLVPGTLYNGKFLERLDTAKAHFEQKNKYDSMIDEIIDFYKDEVQKYNIDISEFNFDKYRSEILYWLKNNYTITDLILVIEKGLAELHNLKKTENMTLNYLFNAGFPKKYERCLLITQKEAKDVGLSGLSESSRLALEHAKW